MGRKNRKGRTPNQDPRRFYRSKREQRALDSTLGARLPHSGHGAGYEAALRDPTGATIGALPRTGEWDAREIRAREPVAVQTCGRCGEWSSRGGQMDPAARGQCLHPGSGFSFPPADMAACAFFH